MQPIALQPSDQPYVKPIFHGVPKGIAIAIVIFIPTIIGYFSNKNNHTKGTIWGFIIALILYWLIFIPHFISTTSFWDRWSYTELPKSVK